LKEKYRSCPPIRKPQQNLRKKEIGKQRLEKKWLLTRSRLVTGKGKKLWERRLERVAELTGTLGTKVFYTGMKKKERPGKVTWGKRGGVSKNVSNRMMNQHGKDRTEKNKRERKTHLKHTEGGKRKKKKKSLSGGKSPTKGGILGKFEVVSIENPADLMGRESLMGPGHLDQRKEKVISGEKQRKRTKGTLDFSSPGPQDLRQRGEGPTKKGGPKRQTGQRGRDFKNKGPPKVKR